MNNQACPCGSNKSFELCCGLYLNGDASAQTPEQLMRSRFSAFCVGNSEYLLRTLAPSCREENERQGLESSMANTNWHSLRVLSSESSANAGIVEFVAFYSTKNSNRVEQLHERSNFISENGTLYYTDGEFLPSLQLGRNDACWCGSGLKLKKCHRELIA